MHGFWELNKFHEFLFLYECLKFNYLNCICFSTVQNMHLTLKLFNSFPILLVNSVNKKLHTCVFWHCLPLSRSLGVLTSYRENILLKNGISQQIMSVFNVTWLLKYWRIPLDNILLSSKNYIGVVLDAMGGLGWYKKTLKHYVSTNVTFQVVRTL